MTISIHGWVRRWAAGDEKKRGKSAVAASNIIGIRAAVVREGDG